MLSSYTPIIVGGCGGISSATVLLASPWVEEDASMTLGIWGLPASLLTYVWLKNGVPLAGATDETYVVESARAEDGGLYSCLISDGGKALHETDRVRVTVVPKGSLPVASLTAVCLLGSALLGYGLRKTLRK